MSNGSNNSFLKRINLVIFVVANITSRLLHSEFKIKFALIISSLSISSSVSERSFCYTINDNIYFILIKSYLLLIIFKILLIKKFKQIKIDKI